MKTEIFIACIIFVTGVGKKLVRYLILGSLRQIMDRVAFCKFISIPVVVLKSDIPLCRHSMSLRDPL